MRWSNEERTKLFGKWAQSHGEADDILALASLAVELRAARGGTMTAELELALLSIEHNYSRLHATTLRQHIFALGSRNSVLEKERDAAHAEVERLKAKLERYSNPRCQREECARERASVDALEQQVERLKARCAALSAAGQVLSAHVDKAGGCANPDPLSGPTCTERGCEGSACRYSNTPSAHVDRKGMGTVESALHQFNHGERHAQRYPCSPTCTHDDAATSGHPERVKEQNVKMARAALGLPERVKERHGVPTWRCSGDAPECSPGCPEHGVGGPTEQVKERSEAFKVSTGTAVAKDMESYEQGFHDGHDDGAEAMRAACWEAVQAWIQREGLEAFENDVKAAIEGAKP